MTIQLKPLHTLLLAAALAVTASPVLASSNYVLTELNRPGYTNIQLWDINDSGVILGNSDGWSFTYEAGHFSALPSQMNGYSIATDGSVYGFTRDPVDQSSHGAIWSKGQLSLYDVPGGSNTQIRAASPDGRYLLMNTVQASGFYASYVLDRSTQNLTQLIISGSTDVYATDVNNLGQVVGNFYGSSGASSRNFVWDVANASATEYLYDGVRFRGINDDGLMTGFSSSNAAIIGRPGSWAQFAVPSSDKDGAWSYGINQSGQFVGFSYDAVSANFHGFLATPVPEPSSLALLFAGLLLLPSCLRSHKRSCIQQ